MKYNPKECKDNPLVPIYHTLKLSPQEPVSVGFLDFCAARFSRIGLICESYDDTLEALKILADIGLLEIKETDEGVFIKLAGT